MTDCEPDKPFQEALREKKWGGLRQGRSIDYKYASKMPRIVPDVTVALLRGFLIGSDRVCGTRFSRKSRLLIGPEQEMTVAKSEAAEVLSSRTR